MLAFAGPRGLNGSRIQVIRLAATLMNSDLTYRRSQLHPLRMWCLSALVVVICVFAGDSTVDASIIGVAVPQFAFDASSAGTGTTQSNETEAASDRQSQQDSAENRVRPISSAQQRQSSTSSTSGSSSLVGGGPTTAIVHVSTSARRDLATSGWVLRDRTDALPSPPGKVLLRPPIS